MAGSYIKSLRLLFVIKMKIPAIAVMAIKPHSNPIPPAAIGSMTLLRSFKIPATVGETAVTSEVLSLLDMLPVSETTLSTAIETNTPEEEEDSLT